MMSNGSRLFGLALAIAVISIGLAGCASEPVFQKLQGSPGQKIGIIDLLSPGVTNAHFGVTVFTTYSKTLQSDWNWNELALKTVTDTLSGAGYKTVPLEIDANDAAALRATDDQTAQNYDGLTREWKDKYERILDKNDVSNVVVLREYKYHLGEYGPEWGGFGIFSMSGKGDKDAFMFVSAAADVVGGHPAHRSVMTCIGEEYFDPSLLGNKAMRDVEISDLRVLKTEMESLLVRKLKFDLIDSGLISGSASCPGQSNQTIPNLYYKP